MKLEEYISAKKILTFVGDHGKSSILLGTLHLAIDFSKLSTSYDCVMMLATEISVYSEGRLWIV